MALQPEGTVSAWLAENEAGSESWWQKIAAVGTPVQEKQDDDRQIKLTFFWRDKQRKEDTSAIERVYLDINGVTDHHSYSPSSLERQAGSDIWYATVSVPADWRGSYSLIPVVRKQLPPSPEGATERQRLQQREWWCSLFPATIADPLNPHTPHGNSRGMRLSGIHLPEAHSQQAWEPIDAGVYPSVDDQNFLLEWKSDRLGNRRRTWLWRPAGTEGEALPLVILLDGQNWVKNMSLLPMLETQTRQGLLPAAVWLMIDAIDDETRSLELPCYADFWLAVQEELLPLARSRTSFTDSPSKTVVAGQSYGGLASLYAGLFWPQRFGCVLTQSGSFWWPNMKFMTHYGQRQEHELGFLTQHVVQRASTGPLKIFQEAGLFEEDIHFVNQQMNQALLDRGHQVNYRSFQGGHDVLCWRGGLVDGVRWLLTDSE